MKKINTNLLYLVPLWIISILALMVTYSHHGHLLVDCGREVYYPTQVLLGKVLYKDIFNIYGPFSYMFNAMLFKIFGVNLNVLYLAGCVCALSVITLIYLISIKFLSKILSFAISIFTVSIGVLSLHLFNFVFPYSYGMLYGLVAFLFSVWLLLKYQKTPVKTSFLYLSCFFAGLCIASKYEFAPYMFIVLYSMIKIKPLKFKEYYYSIFSFLFIPVFCFGILFLQGLRFEDLISTFLVLKKMTQTETLKYFYHAQGIYFNPKNFKFELISFILAIFPLATFVYGFNVKNKLISAVMILLSLFLMLHCTNPLSFSLIPLSIVVLAIWDFKKSKNNLALQILVFSALLFSLKVFWSLAIVTYGIFFVSYLLIAILALVMDKFADKNINQNAIGIYLIILSLFLALGNTKIKKNYLIKTERGRIYTTGYFYKSSVELIDYINKNTKKADSIVILPEGAMINFLTQRPTDNYFTSLIPLYVETFGEEKIINHFKESKPEYIIFNNWDSSRDYYFKTICNDYALSFCSFVAKNYTQEKVIDNGFRYLIFKKK